MKSKAGSVWKDQVLFPEQVLETLKPGMRICMGTGVPEPLTLVRKL